MPTMSGLERRKVWKGFYDFDVDGGAQDTYVLRSNDGPIPAGAVIVGGVLDITVSCASAAGGKMSLGVEAGEDTLAAALEAALTAGRKDIIPSPAAPSTTAVITTVDRNPSLEITLQDFTAGKFDLYLFWQ